MSLASKIAALFNGAFINSAVVPRLSGSVVQVRNVMNSAVSTGTTIVPVDDTIPQITEGSELMTLSITPTNAANTLIIDVVVNAAHATVGNIRIVAALFQDSTANALAATCVMAAGNGFSSNITLRFKMAAGTTSATTFRVRAGPDTAATMTFNGLSGGRLFGGVYASSITITEVTA